jgi:proline dehydrogenase
MAGVFEKVARPAILAASRSHGLRRMAERMPVTREVVHRFVPGETVDDALKSVAVLRDSRRFVSIDYLGEDVTDSDAADKTVVAYLELLESLGRRSEADDVPRSLEVSLKLSALGQALPRDGGKIALENAHTICEKARDVGAWVTVDAEDHTTTDSTLSIVRELRADFPHLGTVLQAYLHRTEADCREFSGPSSRIRLCKGAYSEPASVAFQKPAEVDASYLRCLRVLMEGDGYPMVASHDPQMIAAAQQLVGDTGRGAADYEFQMLYGIRDDEQRRLVGAGHHLRVYTPYGDQWYGYFMRRLAERPANVVFFLRSLVSRS